MVVRVATDQDVAELVRLRELLFVSMGRGADLSPEWRLACARTFEERLADGTLRAFVVDGDAGLAACAVGLVDRRLPGPGTVNGLWGHVSGVVTDPGYRRRGYARLLTVALLDWFQERGIKRVELHATKEAEPLYRELGFAERKDPALTWLAPGP